MQANKLKGLQILIVIGVLFVPITNATVHDGKSFALEKATPQIQLKENPFTLRENWWNGQLSAGENKIIKHQLFVRNEYWFWVGSSSTNAEVSIHMYDGEGKLADAEAFQEKNVAGVRIIPKKSGVYYIRIAIDKATEESVEWAVIYGYR